METLRAYLKTLTPDEQAAFAKRCGTSIGYLRKALSTGPKLDGALVRKLSEASAGAVVKSDLRSDIWDAEPKRKKAA
jgi:hypothetical protein